MKNESVNDELVSRSLRAIYIATHPLPATMPSATAFTTYLLFTANLVNQMGRVLVPAIKTTVLADAEFGAEFQDKVGGLLGSVSLVCLGGKLLGAAVTDRLGGWVVLISVFAIWLVAITATFMAPSVDIFGYAWLLNSLAYTVTWGSIVQVIGAEYDAAGKAAQLAFCASASRFGASIGNIIFGQLLSAGLGWRQVCMPMLPVQALLLALCIYKWSTSAASAAAAPAAGAKKAAGEPAPSVAGAFLSVDFWLMLIPKAVLFTYTQFFMNYIPQLLNAQYGYDHGDAASLGGIAQGGSVVGLLYVGNQIYKKMAPPQKVQLVFVLLAVCGVVPLVLSLGPAVVPTVAVVPLTVLWGLCYAMPFYVPPGEFAMQVGGKSGTGLFTNLFDAAGFAASAMWNPWASAQAKSGDFTSVLYSQAAFGLISMVAMPLCMYRLNAKGAAPKKKAAPATKAKASPKPSPKPKAATPKSSSPAPSPKRAAKSPARSKSPASAKKTPARRATRSPSKRLASKKTK